MRSLSTGSTAIWLWTSLLYLFFEGGSVQALSNPTSRTVVVVGGGVGGLAVASRIAVQDPKCDVVILEKNEGLGGRCGSFHVDTPQGRFRHERGPSLLLLPETYRELFHDCGSSPEDCGLRIAQCVPAYQAVFDDGDRIELGFPDGNIPNSDESKKYSRAKMDSFEVDGAAKWDEYMDAAAAFLDCGLPNFIEERLDIQSFPAFLYQSLRQSGKAWPLKPHSDILDAIFQSDKMKAIASFQDLYVGLQPYRNSELFGGILRKTAPAVFSLLAAIELHPNNRRAGVFAPIGGFGAVTNAFETLARKSGVEISCESTVTKVTPKGVHVRNADGVHSFQEADIVIVNADLPYAKETILSPSASSDSEKYDWDDSFDFSSGVIAFHWSISKTLEDLNTHNVFLVTSNREKTEKSWQISDETGSDYSSKPFNFYVHRASKVDPTAAPAGCEALLVLVPCQTLTREKEFKNLSREEAILKYKEQFDDEMLSNVKEAVLQRLESVASLKSIRESIVHEVVDTPGTYAEQYNVGAGTPFALVSTIHHKKLLVKCMSAAQHVLFQSHGFNQLSLTRPGAESSNHPNVLFVGASSRPGNGVPLVLVGAKLVAEKAMKKLGEVATVEKDRQD